MESDNLLLDLKLCELLPPKRPTQYGVLSWWAIGGHWSLPRQWWVDIERANYEAKRRAKAGHAHISIVTIPGIEP